MGEAAREQTGRRGTQQEDDDKQERPSPPPPKHRGDGDRVIGLMSMLSGVWSQARDSHVAEWSTATAP
eukprot:2708290-Pyramimonas_sp.AAC.1